MKTVTVTTFTTTIYVGFKFRDTGRIHKLATARKVCQEYVDENRLCVTVTPTEYLYLNGGEPGCAVGIINYPRFPKSKREIRKHAIELARRLKDKLQQYKVSVVFPDKTVMLSTEPK